MRSKWTVIGLIVALGILFDPIVGCKREPTNLPHGAKQSGDNGYNIYIDGEPTGYQPGKIYNGNVWSQSILALKYQHFLNFHRFR